MSRTIPLSKNNGWKVHIFFDQSLTFEKIDNPFDKNENKNFEAIGFVF